jgi:2-(1,2-epoxy-1,2-dihydrophenyl)acetyl-CoA isomerase
MTDASTIATGTDDILAAVTDRVAVITLNRPDRRNALSEPMLVGLEGLLEQFESDPAVGAIVLTGAGGAFCAGGDVKEFASAEAEGTGSLPITNAQRRGVCSKCQSPRSQLCRVPLPARACRLR